MEQLASWVTLASFVVSALILVMKRPSKYPQRVVFHALTGLLCAVGGLMMTAFVLKFTGPIGNPMVPSTMTFIGALSCVSLRLKYLENEDRQ